MNQLLQQISQEEILPLRQQEIDLIFAIRKKYRYGSVEIIVRDGIPVDLIRTVERVRLGELSTTEFDENK